ncbi:MAG: hypothetical protein ACI9ON_001989 [Limisphaerales bacterium]|jgi:hypothetical protein
MQGAWMTVLISSIERPLMDKIGKKVSMQYDDITIWNSPMIYRFLPIALLTLALGGCWNGENVHVTMGDVSLGQQLLDLKSAFDQEAITEEEYSQTKQTLLALNSLCENTKSETPWF